MGSADRKKTKLQLSTWALIETHRKRISAKPLQFHVAGAQCCCGEARLFAQQAVGCTQGSSKIAALQKVKIIVRRLSPLLTRWRCNHLFGFVGVGMGW